ncbi:uncharacterized protein BJ212DRAFT_1414272 [Suillus subaureus]|uniref:Uncharacterized protein n=1 Tax=Suillus subaureus TaxID=48587 RepID=A0A9P7ARC9_9AGAM|nr:uncharacterized protein BJ212DRAFT_1414272 [Suillus subaureus]KAG1793817.1 hypothetical protein BJ212DRAFT_1414272 [Suillus subaureus]
MLWIEGWGRGWCWWSLEFWASPALYSLTHEHAEPRGPNEVPGNIEFSTTQGS